MKKLLIYLFASLLLQLGALISPVQAQTGDVIPGHILVKFKSSAREDDISAQLKIHQAQIARMIKGLDVLVLRVPERYQDAILTALSKNPFVEYAERDYVATALMTPNDPYYIDQWAFPKIRSDVAWDTTLGNSVIVGIVDTGVSKTHPDLAGKVVARTNFTDSSTDDDMNGHGTHVGGIVAAVTNNSEGVAGGCPGCQLLSAKVLNDSGSGAYSWVANGIIWAADNNARVINLSLGGSAKSTTLENAVKYAWNHNAVVVAAAGNSGRSSKLYPAAYTNAIAVAATDSQDRKAYFSQYGRWVDIAAPGVNIYSTWTGDGYTYASGTSMATPEVSAAAALVWSTQYGTSSSAVRNRLESTADRISGTGYYWSSGRVNAAKAVAP
ncbi:hypothetical protein A3B02_00685 [Candidatus Roizmanbacteria bacterium RIFCSPLOWO2_01_FULL_42_14]|uniref:Uncharacterized protein n=2 Tax=Candidatus Roizmaniibacteriota TaxID=1752723 RepID=A0A1F7K1R1_9BACT|nr:MAG: hypothetical protein A3B02_00685 [Candidatus Roizmanbacteria bacterium RIFCSPLOWO2_01_FULL_42_14]OGK61813.1 MAG: hypothetical protein A3I56_04155 [Candidatus Roizmanbacteria bacterium RIFCSPLOWO2_02_FULL_43_10]